MGTHGSTSPERTGGRRAKIRALLIGALVIGVGGATTLAAWTDGENATGTFGTSVFGIQGSTNGSAFAKHPSDAPASLDFAATGMTPGDKAFASFDVRTTAGTTIDGTVAVTDATVAGDSAITGNLSYRAAAVPAGTKCSSTVYTGAAQNIGTVFPLPAHAVSAAGANPVRYCFEVTLAAKTPDTAQGKSGSATWVFSATSAT
ncbi:MAG: SipW-dependent-type signal peptide-containing protein [Micrococcaceae bacterium]|nr:SipW-dependent-type signal peptide-containing protein [Micrococcaceae bacterium]